MCFPQQQSVLHWLSLLTVNWTTQTLFLYKDPAYAGPSQVNMQARNQDFMWGGANETKVDQTTEM